MNPLFVTSFDRGMYRTTGVHLVNSFLGTQTPGKLLICHEGGMSSELAGVSPRLLYFDLDGSSFLRSWLHEHRDIIPAHLGGEALSCECSDGPEARRGEHRPGCVFGWFNRNASRWFRKIVSLDHALTLDCGDAIIWLDSDCRFLTRLPPEVLEGVFADRCAFFLKGPMRVAVESGVIGFKRNADGIALLRTVIDRFRSARFRQDERWDDGYQFQMVFAEQPEARIVDIGVPSPGSPDSVLEESPLGSYLAHFKGVHGPVLQLMI